MRNLLEGEWKLQAKIVTWRTERELLLFFAFNKVQ